MATTRRRKRAPRILTDLQAARYDAMRRAGVDQLDVLALLRKRRKRLSRATIGHVILDRFRNEDVIAAFCELTNTDAATLFPAASDAASDAVVDGQRPRVRVRRSA
jgi:hypothetical protein